jgi:hypothetical protein
MAEVISLLTEDEDDALDLEERVVHTNVPPVLPDGTIFWRIESDIFQCSRIKISFTIQGAPVALSRPRIRFGYCLLLRPASVQSFPTQSFPTQTCRLSPSACQHDILLPITLISPPDRALLSTIGNDNLSHQTS